MSISSKKILLFFLVLSLLSGLSACAKPCPDDPTPPENEPQYPTVIIDAGHGGEDGGAIGVNGAHEKDLNLALALELAAMLDAVGIETRLTRQTDTLLYDRNADFEGRKKILDMQARRAICEEYDDAIFVSIHMNSFPIEKYCGLQVYYSESAPRSAQLAEAIQSTVRKSLQYDNDRKTKPSGEDIYLLNDAKHPSVLIECGFLSNREECELLCQRAYQKRLCTCIYAALINYFSSTQNNNAQIS